MKPRLISNKPFLPEGRFSDLPRSNLLPRGRRDGWSLTAAGGASLNCSAAGMNWLGDAQTPSRDPRRSMFFLCLLSQHWGSRHNRQDGSSKTADGRFRFVNTLI